ncbi:MAG: hypothetical protein IKI93_13895, partial [Clostridia bacterium]|nr:hypothetical protein [Clostridia bacterium]
FLASVVSLISGLAAIGYSMNECLIARREEMRILVRFGMAKKQRMEVKFRGNMSIYLPSVMLTAGFGLTAYLGMSIYGGDRLKFSQIILAVSVCVILTAITAILAAVLSAESEKSQR